MHSIAPAGSSEMAFTLQYESIVAVADSAQELNVPGHRWAKVARFVQWWPLLGEADQGSACGVHQDLGPRSKISIRPWK